MQPDGSSSSEASPSATQLPRPIFDNLPQEVVNLIAASASEKDQRWKDADDSCKQGTLANPWVSKRWRGRSVAALSLVCKRFRLAALPFLCSTLTAKQARSAAFRLGKIPPDLLKGITHLCISSGEGTDIVNIAVSLAFLPAIRKLSLNLDSLETRSAFSLATAPTSTETDLVLDAFAQNLRAVSRLVILRCTSPVRFDNVARLLSPAVRALEFEESHVDERRPDRDNFPEDLATILQHLESLAFQSSPTLCDIITTRLACGEAGQLSRLRLLIISLDARHINRLLGIASIAPHLTKIELSVRGRQHTPAFEVPDDVATFLRVNSVKVSAPRMYMSLLRYFKTSPLREMTLVLSAPDEPHRHPRQINVTDIFSSSAPLDFASSLRRISLYNSHHLAGDQYNFSRRGEKCGIEVHCHTTYEAVMARSDGESNSSESDRDSDTGSEDGGPEEADRLARRAVELLDWGRRRADWLRQLGDRRGISELFWATHRLWDVQRQFEL